MTSHAAARGWHPDDVRLVQRDYLLRAGVTLSPEFEHALWPTDYRPREKLVTGGVQAGKSTLGAAEVFTDLPLIPMDAARDDPWRYWFVLPTYETPKTELEYLVKWAQDFYGPATVNAHMPNGSAAEVSLMSGRVIVETRSAQDPERIAARALRGVVLCEAGQQPQSVRTAALERTVTLRGWNVYTGTLEDDEAKPRYAWYDTLAQAWRDDPNAGGVAVSLPSWANRGAFPLGAADPEFEYRRAQFDEHTYNRRYAGIPSGVQFPVYGEVARGDYDATSNLGDLAKVTWCKPWGAGGYDFGTTPGHPSVLLTVTMTAAETPKESIAVIRDAWVSYAGDAVGNENRRKTMGHDYGIPNSRWRFDPMLRHSAELVGASVAEKANDARLEKVSWVKARHLDGRLLYDLTNPNVVKVFEQMRRVHYQKRTSPTKGEYYEYHRADDDLAAALEDAIAVIDGGGVTSIPDKAQMYPFQRHKYGKREAVAAGWKAV